MRPRSRTQFAPLTAVLLAALLGASALAPTAAAQTAPKITAPGGDVPGVTLYVGNSFFYYNNSLHAHVANLARGGVGGVRPRGVSVTISGSGLDWHDVESYFRPGGIGRYSFDANNNVVFNDPGKKLFDAVVMMDCSQCPLHPTLKTVFADYTRKHAETVRKHGARPVFFMSWAYADKPDMIADLAEAYTKAGNDLDALVIPAGLAFARSIAARPDLNLYAPDKRHPSLAGTYLAANVTYATLFGVSPVGNGYTAGLDPAIAAHLQSIAQETVTAYFKK